MAALIRSLAWLAFAVLCSTAAWAVFRLEQLSEQEIRAEGKQLNTTFAKMDQTLDASRQTLTTINRDCGGGHPCGTLADVAQTLNTLRLTAGLVEIAARHEDRRMTTLDGQEETIYQSTDRSLVSLGTTLNAAQLALERLSKVETGLTVDAADLDRVLDRTEPVLAGLAGMTSSGRKILADGAYETHKLVHPEKKKLGFWAAVWAGIKVIHELEPPIF